MHKIFVFIFLFLFFEFYNAQDSISSPHQKWVSWGFDIGFSNILKYDRTYHRTFGLTEIESHTPLNIGLDIKIELNKKKKWLPEVLFGINSFRTQGESSDTLLNRIPYSFTNRYISLHGALLYSYPISIGTKELRIYGGGFANKTLMRFVKSYFPNINEREKTFKLVSDTFTMGGVFGLDYPLGKTHIGLYYYQRLYFSGFNREISRLVLRISI